MDDKARLMELVIEAKRCDPEDISFCEFLCEFLLMHGVTIAPSVPGPFHNGEQHMKDKIISKFQSVAESMACITLAQAIKMVEDL